MKKIIYSFLLSFYCTVGFAQSHEIDSLKQVLKTLPEDTNRVNMLRKLGGLAREVGNYDIALVLYNQSATLAQKLNFKNGIAYAYIGLGIIYYQQSNYPKALGYYLKSMKIGEETRDKKGLSINYNNIGSIYLKLRNYPKALEYYLKDLKLSEEIGDKKDISYCYSNIGSIYLYQSNYPKTLEYYLKSLKIGEEIGDKKIISASNTNLGVIYSQQNNYSKALECYLKSLKIKKETGDKESYGNCYSNLSTMYYKLNESKKAIAYADSAIAISKEIGDIDNERLAYGSLAQAQNKIGNYKAAYEAQVKYQALNDSVFNTENSKQMGDLKTNFEVEKKEVELKAEQDKKDVIAKEEKQKQRIILFSVCGFLLLVAVLAGVVFRSLRQSRQANKIIEHQKHLVEEKHKEITDSINYAERIQRSFLATEETLNINLKEHFVYFQPKDVVSGDFYWASKLNNKNFALVTADSTGHGVPGAIMSLLNITSLEKAVEQNNEPAAILNQTRKTIIERLKKDGSADGGKDGMDASLICFDFEKNKFTYAAANNPIWVVRQNELIELKPDKMPIGKHDKDTELFSQHEFEFQKGDLVYTLTDGMPDQFGGLKGKKFMYKQLKEFLIFIANESMEIQKQKLSTAFTDWKGNLEQVDDVCIIGIRC